MGKKKNRGTHNKFQEADRLFSHVIRLKEVRFDGYVQCFTCDKVVHFNNIQCGHFIKRADAMTRFLEENCRPQCHHCNVTLGGNEQVFEDRLELDYPGLPDKLREISRQVVKLTSSDLQELTNKLRKKIKECGGTERVSKY